MPTIELIRSLMTQAIAQGSRSTALQPLGWALAITLSAMIAALWQNAPSWITLTLVLFAAAVLIVFLAAYLFLLVRDRDALRSERFMLSKMAIEKSVKGDNLEGFIAPGARSLPPPARSEEQ